MGLDSNAYSNGLAEPDIHHTSRMSSSSEVRDDGVPYAALPIRISTFVESPRHTRSNYMGECSRPLALWWITI